MLPSLLQIDFSYIAEIETLGLIGFLALGYALFGYLILFSDTLITGKRHEEVKQDYARYIELKNEQIDTLKAERDELKSENSEQNRDLVRLTEDFKGLIRDVVTVRITDHFQRDTDEERRQA